MRTGNLTTWLLRGTYPRLYVSIVAIILLVTGVRYHYLLAAETEEALQQGSTELRRASDPLQLRLAAEPAPDADTVTRILTEGLAQAAPAVASIKWQAADQPAIEVTAFPYPAVAPKWFTDWLDLSAPVQQSGLALADGTSGRLTVTAHPQPLTDQVWATVLVQARISALNIFTIFFLLTLLLRANARMLQRLAQATDAFRQGYLSTRMEVTGTLESRAMAETFNDMAGSSTVKASEIGRRDPERQRGIVICCHPGFGAAEDRDPCTPDRGE